MSNLVTRLTLGAVGLTCKTFLRSGYCASVTVNGLENIEKALKDERRKNGAGIITISNHISTLDDPVTWGVVPWKWYFTPGMIRWSLGASDIIFINPIFSAFFRKGQVFETFRGSGIYQPAVDSAIERLNQGEWIHLFGEGKIHQPGRYPPLPTPPSDHQYTSHVPDQNQARHSLRLGHEPPLLLRFKWGAGRILMESKEPPIVIPMWLTGFQDLMPEGRSFPWKYLPRRNVHLSVTFGEPISRKALLDSLARYDASQETRSLSIAAQNCELTAVLQREVERLGRRILGRDHL
ncbi:hypothetical protein PHLGIDRAFT_31685 [Phlebiopsis gigantea 11061_1 CR5-6]|uniref:Tafazzin family protein n=1 Tax=Phlebiopsis gigantea (strain 11061_1 CR5-6) TaxID=745531 RepID=A0A0C3PE49_PHLG1|nr:hypothetical protein PHLGIDRAFT_31685 [Phlebiopsis gigantea 11061_1 CR5-6]